MRPGWHSTTPLSARTSYENENRACSSRVMELPKAADNSPRVASEKQHGTESENTCNFPIFNTFGRYIWKAIAPRSKHSGTLNLELEVRRVCTIDGSLHPLPVIYMFGTSASDYICHPNIHYLLYFTFFNFHARAYFGILNGFRILSVWNPEFSLATLVQQHNWDSEWPKSRVSLHLKF